MTSTRLLSFAFVAFVLQGCASALPPDPPVAAAEWVGDSSLFGTRPAIVTPDELHRLPPQHEAAFVEWFNHPSRAAVGPHVRLYTYLENLVASFEYQPDTRTASEVLAHKGGNCMSLAILTTALAQLAGIEISYQLMDDQPVYEYQGSVVIKGVHVSSLVTNPEWQRVAGTSAALGVSPGFRIDYFPELRGRFLANLDRNGYLTLYYDNIASHAVARGDYDTAYWNLRESLHYTPDHGASLNMLAVVHRRKGDDATAEAIYRYGIARADDKLSLLKNYHSLLVAQDRHAEAETIAQRLARMDDSSPLHWLQLARASHANGDWSGAIAYYRRVLQLAPYMHEVHLGIAQAYHASGELRRAESELAEALSLANRVSTRNLYKAKLLSLRKEF